MDNSTNKIISNYIAYIADKFPRLQRVFLFGSCTRRLNRVDSDIDIAFVIDNLDDKEIFDVQVQLLVFASEFDTRIEPHPLSSADFAENTPLVSEIKKYGIEIETGNPEGWLL